MANIDELLEGLTPPQREAVTHVDGPLLIVAGAGSGKTRVITRRVAYLIAQGVPPYSILAITFTNKASAEMKARIAAVADRPLRDFGRLDQPWPLICTFHSLCLRILRHYAGRVGLPVNFSIFDTSDQNKLIKEALKMLDISSTNFSPASIHSTISNAKNQLINAEAFAQKAGDFFQRTVARVFTKYQQLLNQNNALDFDDLLLRTAHAMRDHPDVLRELQDRFQYILIDEYQDTNHAQYVLAHALALRHQNLCVVGDPDQCLPAGTLISTAEGPKAIELIHDGHQVLSANNLQSATSMKIDKAMTRPYNGRLVTVTTESDNKLSATPNHVGFAKPCSSSPSNSLFQAVRMSNIYPGMIVPVLSDDQIVESVVKGVEWQDFEGPVYDLSVPQTRNYIAGGIVVHNSIYAWRGADLQNILDFETDYPNSKIVRLEQNYRSTKRILRIASQLIAQNLQRKEKTLWTENAEGEPARVFLCQDEHDEASVIMQQLRVLHDKHGYDWNKMAIFYRMNALSRVMEGELMKAGIPYQIARGTEFYNRKEIKDALAYLRVIANPSDEVSLSRIVNVPARGLGDAALKVISAHSIANGMSLWQAMENAGRIQGLSTRAISAAGQFVQLVGRWRKMAYVLDARPAPVQPLAEGEIPYSSGMGGPPMASEAQNTGEPPVPQESIASFEGGLFGQSEDDPFGATDSAILDEIDLEDSGSSDADMAEEEPTPAESAESAQSAQPAQAAPIRGRVRSITEAVFRQSGLEDYLKKIGGEELDELHNVEELITSTAEFDRENPEGSLNDYLAQISLVSDADHVKGSGGSITLMTLHAAKGLEFPVVAMIGLEEGILPHSRSRGNQNELEEERRLCFVGMTRAQERLILSKAAQRASRGVTERTIPSPFLGEIPPEDVDVTDRTGIGSFALRRGGTGAGGWPTTQGLSRQKASETFVAPKLTGKFANVREGVLVRHKQYGLGRVREVTRTGDDRTRAVVRFNQGGEKVFYLELAHLDVLE